MEVLLTIVLLCRNRPGLAEETIRSILKQNSKAYQLVVSDNSTNFDMQELMRQKFPDVIYKRWGGHLSHFQHVTQAISLTQTRFLTIFHDDDHMEPDYATAIIDAFKVHSTAGAIACNSYVMNAQGVRQNGRLMFSQESKVHTFCNGREIVLRYLDIDQGGIAPFNCYAYNLPVIRGLSPDEGASRHYTDTVFIAEVADRAPVIWLNTPYVTTRIHPHNISHACGARDYKLFIQWVRGRFGNAISEAELDLYRIPHLFYELEKRKRMSTVALRYLALRSPRLIITSANYRHRLARKILRKLNPTRFFRK